MSAQTTAWPERQIVAAPRLPQSVSRTDLGRLVRRAARWLLAAVAVALLVRFARQGWPEIRESLSLLTAEQAPFIGLAVFAEVLWLLAMSQVYRSALLAFGGSLGRPAALRVSMAAFTLSRILPGGGAAGGAVAALELVALGNPPLRTVSSMLASWWITMTALSAIVFAGIASSVLTGTLGRGYLVAPAAALAFFTVGGTAVAGAARSPQVRARLSRLIVRGADRLGTTTAAAAGRESLDALGGAVSVRGLLAVLAWGIAVWMLDAAALWFALTAFGWQTDIGVLLFGYGVANLIAALPELTPGWLGIIETSVAAALSAFGVPLGIAVVSVLAYRLVSYWLPTAAGVPAAVSVMRRRPRLSSTSISEEKALS